MCLAAIFNLILEVSSHLNDADKCVNQVHSSFSRTKDMNSSKNANKFSTSNPLLDHGQSTICLGEK